MKPYPSIRRSGRGAHCCKSASFGSLNISASHRRASGSMRIVRSPVTRSCFLVWAWVRGDMPAKEVAHRRADLRGVGLQREVAGVEEAHDRVWDVASEHLGPLRQEKRVVLAPHRQEGRLVGAKILLEC